jgi:hypothetical protein
MRVQRESSRLKNDKERGKEEERERRGTRDTSSN